MILGKDIFAAIKSQLTLCVYQRKNTHTHTHRNKQTLEAELRTHKSQKASFFRQQQGRSNIYCSLRIIKHRTTQSVFV